ncbi:restriction endonuclease subunit S [Streptomyces sp. NPDC002405]
MSESVDGQQIPSNWTWVELGEVAESVRNGIYVSRPGVAPDGVPILRIGAVRPMRLDLSDLRYTGMSAAEVEERGGMLSPGDLLFTRYNGNPEFVGVCARMPHGVGELTYPDKLIRVRLDPDVFDSHFVCYVWASEAVRQQVRQHVKTSAGQVGIAGGSLKKIRLPLPPLAEQRRIVEALEEQLSRLDAAEANVRKVTRRIDVLLGRVTDFTADIAIGADEPAAPFPEGAGSIDGQLSRIPADWQWMRLGELADVVGGVTKDKKKQSDPDLPEVPYLRVANVQRGRLDLENVTTIRVPPKKAEQLRLQVGDVLMNEGGDRDKLGRGWVWHGEVPDAIHQNHVFRARIRQGLLMPELLSWYANGAAKWFEENGKQSTNLASISLSKIKNLPVPVPPETEQGRIAERIEERLVQLRHARVAAERVLRQGGKLRNALLRKAFEGNLVPQDKADEPAAAVLARIAAERAAQPKPKRTRKAPAKMPIPRAAQATIPAPEPTPVPILAVQQEIEL